MGVREVREVKGRWDKGANCGGAERSEGQGLRIGKVG